MPKVRTVVQLTEEQRKALERIAKSQLSTLSALIRCAVEEWLKTHKS